MARSKLARRSDVTQRDGYAHSAWAGGPAYMHASVGAADNGGRSHAQREQSNLRWTGQLGGGAAKLATRLLMRRVQADLPLASLRCSDRACRTSHWQPLTA